jgi:hypothetical protein
VYRKIRVIQKYYCLGHNNSLTIRKIYPCTMMKVLCELSEVKENVNDVTLTFKPLDNNVFPESSYS